jgi:hypothetical protein
VTTAAPAPSLNDQIAEVAYEIRMREFVYPRFVATKKLRQGEADEHLRRMRAVLTTLTSLRDDVRKEPAADAE